MNLLTPEQEAQQIERIKREFDQVGSWFFTREEVERCDGNRRIKEFRERHGFGA